jgi:hypothetical protein
MRRPSRGGDKGPEHTVGVRDDVRAAIKQGSQVSGVNLEISSPPGAGRIAAPVRTDERPPSPERSQRAPRRGRTRATMNKEHLRTIALADNRDRIHRRECSGQGPTRWIDRETGEEVSSPMNSELLR